MSNRKQQGYDYLIKVLIIGNSGVGKTNLLMRYTQDAFTTNHLSTVGIDFKSKTLKQDGIRVRLQVWDTAGQERFKTITQTYYRGAMGILLAYAVDDLDSFSDLKGWVKQMRLHTSQEVLKVLVATKCDSKSRKVSTEEGIKLAQELNMSFFQTSAKENINVEQCFSKTAFTIAAKFSKQIQTPKQTSKPLFVQSNKQKKKKKCC